ncbi:FecCD family ABC transporter permease [Mycobacterium haemophilum]|uniref:Sugar ABC transporter substrate-binding protein n=1 Tax=Mycobacterium haemophilum TaxID=29311 RepID=A0A0I9V3Y9_9MYCO|nr:sugar ABC transporter substrate-binding protein [Mycobacterium haemophilum DSM 44634]KLO33161.1 sugar ABC transporter substrate-binding protein [Mycobacterium haemophilum]KLO38116.1 sugar ABC transporter substrate-binding protein [Mycobacterium haemophilum]KLO44438.1 sugar ABC transporter substrate-binding protein [Mycobacterium haemophilum]KLO49550.1 sugar ABC transporter substrate-binding protein [Mycobacterium haemophilum]
MRISGTRRVAVTLALLLVALLGAMWAGVALGTVAVPWRSTAGFLWAELTGGTVAARDGTLYRIVIDSRVPRVLSATLVGAALSAVGVAVQAMARNALADPYVLGVSSGASVGATAVVLFGAFGVFGCYALPAAAFLGALAATVLVYAIAQSSGRLSPLRLVLSGTALGYGFSAVTTVLVFLEPRGDTARSVMFWLLGSMSAATWRTTALVGIVAGGGLAALLLCASRLNVLALGDDAATSMGLSVDRFRGALFVLTAAVTGVVVSVCGAIGFVGLVVPHVARLLVGGDHRRVLLVAPAIGAVFLLVADLLARVVVPPQELPIGAITAAVGVPLFVVLLRRKLAGAAGA